MEEKTKKKRVQKRAARKTAKAAELVSTAASPVVTTKTKKMRKRSSKANKAKATSKTPKVISFQPTLEQVQVRAYFISERIRKFGLPGDDEHDWFTAERT